MFSPTELNVLEVLGRKKMSIGEISEKICDANYSVPINASIVISNAIRRIALKCEKNKLSWTIVGKGGGRHGRIVWRTKRKASAR